MDRLRSREAGFRQGGHSSAAAMPPKREKRRTAREATPEVRVVASVDYALLFIVVVLVLIGVVMVFSASYWWATTRFGGDPFHFLRPHIFFAVGGFLVMLLFANINYELLRPLTTLLYAVSVGLLILVIFIGDDGGGATRWIDILGFRFQPSEVARAAVIFMMAFMIEKYPALPRSIPGLALLTATLAVIPVLIALPGGFTAAIISAAIGLGMIVVASPLFWWIMIPGGAMAAGAVAYIRWAVTTGGGPAIFGGFRHGRILAWIDPFSDPRDFGFQPINGLYAIASGGWFGQGIGNSRQVTFIPEPHNDMIFAVIVEELGFLGAAVIIILFAMFIWRGILTSMRAPDTFSSMIALGIVFAIGLPAVINIGVVTNTIPNTGVNLPFISYGGTSLLVSMALVGVLLNISRYSVQKK